MILIPIRHEDLRGRRWPYITIAIVALNCVVFLATHWTLDRESEEIGQVRAHILLLAAAHPEAQTTPQQQQLIDRFQKGNSSLWNRMKDPNRQLEDAWDAQMRLWEPDRASEEMAALGADLERIERDSLMEKLAYYPYRTNLFSFLSANFLHGGWLHLIFNMWFLWLAGTVLEDTWGRVIYPIFYFLGGVVGLLSHGLAYPNSIVPVIGASGAVAALMGGFLVRFTKTRVEMLLLIWLLIRPVRYRFHVPAYVLLPFWLLTQVLSASLPGEGGVAYWAHIGGFLFGVVAALALRFSGIEKKVDQAIEAQVSWSADPRVVEAGELLAKNQADAAIAALQTVLREKPEMVEAHEMLERAYWAKHDLVAFRETLVTLCRLHLKAKELDLALQKYEEYVRNSDRPFPDDLWLELCRILEQRRIWDRAAAEYENLAHAYASEKSSVPALVSAARIQLKQLNRPDEAIRLYREAQNSTIPHRDWDGAIKIGLKEAETTASRLAVRT